MSRTPYRTVCVIGIFPPAWGGQAAVNEFHKRLFVEAGARVSVIDISPPAGPRSWWRSLARAPKVVWGIAKLLFLSLGGSAESVYIGLAGHRGQFYDLIFVAIARLTRARLALHHDSYRYLTSRSALTATVISVAGARATHIVLCEAMGRLLESMYPSARQRIVVSNATNVDEPHPHSAARRRLATIGFIANINPEKGVFEFIDAAERIHQECPEIGALLAGPMANAIVNATIRARLGSKPWIEYVGPVQGVAKADFYQRIDVLLLPTRYVEEAEPRVINEALSHGSGVISSCRGCIPEVLSAGAGIAIDANELFAEAASRQVVKWRNDPAAFFEVSRAALETHRILRVTSDERLHTLVNSIAHVNTGAGARPGARRAG